MSSRDVRLRNVFPVAPGGGLVARVSEVLRYPSIITRDEMLCEFTHPRPGFVLSDLCCHGFDTEPRRAQNLAVGAAFHRSLLSPQPSACGGTSHLAPVFLTQR
jgi:hypothetical protein